LRKSKYKARVAGKGKADAVQVLPNRRQTPGMVRKLLTKKLQIETNATGQKNIMVDHGKKENLGKESVQKMGRGKREKAIR